MNDDNEFGDEIDWSSVPLNSIAASIAVPRPRNPGNAGSGTNNNPSMTTTAPAAAAAGGSNNGNGAHHYYSAPGSGGAATAAYQSGYLPQSTGANGQNHSMMAAAGPGAAATNLLSSANDVDALRRQIQDLQNQLQSKDDQIFELEATAATSHVESTHRTQQAEAKATQRIHLVEEELRRTRMEAEKYKGSWIRQKKRVAELESSSGHQQQKVKNEMGGVGNHHSQHVGNSHFAGNRQNQGGDLSTWGGVGGGVPSDIELRKVTPSISNEESPRAVSGTKVYDKHPEESPSKVSSGSKRKTRQTLSPNDKDDIVVSARCLAQQVVFSAASSANSTVGDSVGQRLAWHLLNHHDMGCYKIPRDSSHASLSILAYSAGITTTKMDVEKGGDRAQQHSTETDGDEDEQKRISGPTITTAAMQQDHFIANKTEAYVKSILHQMVEATEIIVSGIPSKSNLSASGLVQVLFMKFNLLFHCQTAQIAANSDSLDADGDHVMEQENDPNQGMEQNEQSPLGRNKSAYQRMALKLPCNAFLDNESQASSSECVTYTIVSWRAALYLLHVLHDILLLSGNARDELRWCFYQSRQSFGSAGGSGGSNSSSPNSRHEMSQGGKDDDGAKSHPRIEGLPPTYSGRCADVDCKEVLWTMSCQQSSRGQVSDAWDPMTMTRPCNIFFELLVGLMKGNVFEHSQIAGEVESSDHFGLEQTLIQLVQLKAIDLVMALMSDAPPYDHSNDSHGNRTPYLWKFWFDSLLPSYGSMKPSSDTPPIGDILSPWEKRNINSDDNLLGSGRKHSTRLLDDAPSCDTAPQSKQGSEKQSRAKSKASRSSSTPESSRGNKTKPNPSAIHDGRRQQGRLSLLVNDRILQLLSHFVLSSTSVYQSLYQIVDEETKASLGKRTLAAILDFMEECIVPFLSLGLSSDFCMQDVEQRLQLCSSCLQFLLIMSRSNEGIRMLRLQMRLESEEDEPSRWSQSAIGCVTLVLDGTLSFVREVEGSEMTVHKLTNLAQVLNAIVKQCVIFFKTILMFVEQQRHSSSKAATLLALISEHRTIFQSCCQLILAHQSPRSIADPPRLLHFGERLKYDVRDLFEELVIDAERENGNGK